MVEPEVMPGRPAMLVSLHDVCPASWPDYVALLEELPGIRTTLLVVPDFHHQGSIEAEPAFCRDLEQRRQQGDELVLHGYYHQDESPPPRGPVEWIRRRVLTHEGEFAAASHDEARDRIEAGMALFRQQNWPLEGFVAPGWLYGEHTAAVLRELGFSWYTDHRHLWRTADGQRQQLPTLVWSARSAWRRVLSERWNQRLLAKLEQAPVLRLALHPVDLVHERSRRFWVDCIRELQTQRRMLTKTEWFGELS